MSGTFTPRPGAARPGGMVLAQARMEARLLLRNGEQLLVALGIPVIVLIAGVLGAERIGLHLDHPAVDEFTPGVLALAIMSSAFTSVAIATGFERRYGVLKRLGTTPLSRGGLLLGKVLALLMVQILQVLVIGAVGLMLGWHPVFSPAVLPPLVLGTAAFAGLGLLIAGVLRAEATLAVANLIYLVLMVAGGVVLPTSAYAGAAPVLRLLPSGALGDALRAALQTGAYDTLALATLAVWALVAGGLAARTFRWE